MTQRICNKCGEVTDVREECFTIERVMPYGSKHDGDLLNLDLCISCFDDIVSQCKHNPITDRWITKGEYSG